MLMFRVLGTENQKEYVQPWSHAIPPNHSLENSCLLNGPIFASIQDHDSQLRLSVLFFTSKLYQITI